MALPINIIFEECVADDNPDDDEEEDSDDSYEEPRLGKEGVNNGDEEKEKDNYQIVEEVVKARQLEKLKVEQCKVYLRKHGLRLTGNKDILIQRIREHLEFRIASKSATSPPRGTRLVTGRILKESYGAGKQQHTFTIEVLWSTREKPLPPLYQLLIKGRNLYRLNTMRRNWEDEAERQKAVSEKQARGDVARSNKETREIKELRKKLRQLKRKCKKNPTSANIAMKTTPQNPQEKKLGTGNVLNQHPERQPFTSMNCNPAEKHMRDDVSGSKTRVHKKETRKMVWQLERENKKKSSSISVATNTTDELPPQKPPEKRSNNLQPERDPLPGKAKCEGQNMLNKPLNKISKSPSRASGRISIEEETLRCGPKLDSDQQASLGMEISPHEIKQAMFAIKDDNKAQFFKEQWNTDIGADLRQEVMEFFHEGRQTDHTPAANFRGSNVFDKIITKIIDARLLKVLPSILNPAQAGFIEGRASLYNVMLAQKLLGRYARPSNRARCMVLVDITKAFDTVSWKFLEEMLLGLGVPSKLWSVSPKLVGMD